MNVSPDFHVLVVEDDRELAQMVKEFLELHSFRISVEERGDAAVDRIIDESPDAVILDVNLPGLDGFGVCRAVRQKFRGPILILTARGDEVDEVVGLEVGADDYLAKPVRPRVLLARLRAHLRKNTQDANRSTKRIEVGSLVIDAGRRVAECDGRPLDLTTAEFDLLWLLAENVGQVLNRSDIYEKLHGFQYDGVDRSIDLRVSRLRKKLEENPNNPRRIKSVRGVGYMLSMDA